MLKFLSAILVSLFIAVTALADSFLPPCPQAIKSEDKKLTFIMLPTQKPNECGGRQADDAAAGKAIREKYSQSGLYEDGDPTKLRWSINETWDYDRIYIANDGIHLVRIPGFGRMMESVGVELYANGKSLRKLSIGDLVEDRSKVRYSTSMAFWHEGSSLDNAGSKFRIKTVDGINYEIDLATGEPTVTSRSSPKPDAEANATPATNGNSSETGRPTISCLAIFILVGATLFIGPLARR